jgi:hypothetical protein
LNGSGTGNDFQTWDLPPLLLAPKALSTRAFKVSQ